MFQMPNLSVYNVNEVIAEEAARLRAVYNLKTPDAIIVATAIIYKADVFLTNDHRLAVIKEIPVVKLDELLKLLFIMGSNPPVSTNGLNAYRNKGRALHLFPSEFR